MSFTIKNHHISFSVHTSFYLGAMIAVTFIIRQIWLNANLPSNDTNLSTHAATVASLSGLHVQRNKLVDVSGNQVILRGVDKAGTEYMCIQGSGIFDGPNDAASVQAMRSWGINAVLIPINEDCWLGINGVPAAYGGANYQNAIKTYVSVLESNSIYPVIAYMWGAPGTQKALDHPAIPDADHAPATWTSIANTFKGDNKVVFRLQEEPHDITWQCFRDGGSACNVGYTAVGMQTLVNTIRATGATNVIAVPGIDWSNTMNQFLTYKPTDPQNALMAMADVYPTGNACGSVSCYNSQYLPVINVMPFAAGEFGESVNGNVCGTSGIDTLMNWFDAHGAGYLGWVWDTWGTSCGDLSLITNYNGTPHSPNGTDFKNHLLSLVGVSPTIQNTATPTPTNTPTSTLAPTVRPTLTPTPTIQLTPTPTFVPGSTRFSFTIFLHGIGNAGDNANKGYSGNINPLHPQRTLTVEVYNSQNQLVLTKAGIITYDVSSGSFKGTIDMGTTLTSGVYQVKVKVDQFLKKYIPGIVTIIPAQTITILTVDLTVGDITGDNIIDIRDYNEMMGCYSDLAPAKNCNTTLQVVTDLNDDGQVGMVDYNLFIRELQNNNGQ